jgi:probable F420-dependent oxidoreductase
VRLGISLNPVRPDGDAGRVLRVAREAEQLGFDAISMSGQVLDYPLGSSLDPLVLLSAVAGATERVQLLTSVLVVPAYNPVVLANQAATLDVLSGGRFALGVGVGFNPPEFAALGVPFTERGRRTDDHLAAMRALWSERPAHYEGRFTTLRGALLGAAPHTPGGPPVWVGGHSDAALRRALRFGRAWIGVSMTPAHVADIRVRLARLAGEVGRDPATLELNGVYYLIPPGLTFNGFLVGHPLGGKRPTGEGVADELLRLAEAGVRMCDLILPVAPDEVAVAARWVAEEVRPRLGASQEAGASAAGPSR